MDGIDLKELRELVEFLKANEIAEFDVEKGDLKLRLQFAGKGAPAMVMSHPAAAPVLMAAAATAPVPPPSAAPAPAAAETHHIVKSPIVGTFYESPSPGAPAFVKVGDLVEVGQVLCIVEAMKLMNEIEADIAGELVERIAQSGQPVEYGQSLFAIRPR